MCAKGCGIAINVSDEDLMEAGKLGVALNVAHEICPRDAKVLPRYRVQITITRLEPDSELVESVPDDMPNLKALAEDAEGTVLFTNGSTVEAPTFKDAYPQISKALSAQWAEVDKWKGIVEQELPTKH